MVKCSIKKQIFQKKGALFTKSFDVVFIFATFDIPHCSIQKIKRILQNSMSNEKTSKNTISKNNLSSNQSIYSVSGNVYDYKKKHCFSKVFQKTESEKSPSNLSFSPYSISNSKEKFYNLNPFLHIENKSLIGLYNSTLPLYGPTLLIGCQKEEDAEQTFIILKSFFKKGLLGGFYKGQFLTKKVFKALCIATSRKTEVYQNFYKCLKMISLQNIKLVRKTSVKLAYLCKHRQNSMCKTSN